MSDLNAQESPALIAGAQQMRPAHPPSLSSSASGAPAGMILRFGPRSGVVLKQLSI